MMKTWLFPTIAAVGVATLAVLLLTVAIRSPYTHANLVPDYEPNYTRTAQALVGAPVSFEGPGPAEALPADADPVARGHELFVTEGCASCHGLDGHGGIIGPSIAGTKEKNLSVKTHVGPKGMPEFSPSALTTSDLDAIAAYLKAMSK
jgi:mono/diheme cytochrome c family protein